VAISAAASAEGRRTRAAPAAVADRFAPEG